jgi:AAA domain
VITTNRSYVVDFSRTLDPFFADLFGAGVGYVAVSYGKVPNRVTFYEWPAERERLIGEATERNRTTNVFYCPVLRQTPDVSPMTEDGRGGGLSAIYGAPVEPLPCLWADVDLVDDEGDVKDVNHTLLRRLAREGAWRVRSGRAGHEHVYIPLVAPVDLATFERLNTALKNALGADNAQSHVKWLRLPTFLSYKPKLDRPREVTITQAPTTRWAVDELEALIRPQAGRSHAHGRRQRGRAPGRQRATETRVKSLLRRYANEPGDRSDQFHAVVLGGVEDGVSLDRLEQLLSGHVVAERFEREGRLRKMIEDSAKKATPGRLPDASDEEAPARQTSWTLGELMSQTFPELTWAVDGLVPEGLTLLVAAPKIGKSFLTMNLALALVFDRLALGSLRGDTGEVLVIPLDDPSPRRMQTRLKEIMDAAGLDPCDQRFELHLETDWPTLAEGGGDQLDEWLENHPSCSLVVIDTLSRLRDEEARKSADPGKPDEKAMAEFKRIADKHRVAIIGTHHDKKGESDDFLDMVSGNKKLTGGADTIVYLKRARNEGHAIAKVTGRDVEEREVALDFRYPLWVVSDRSPAELGMGELRLKIVDFIRENDEATISEIAKSLGEPYTRVQQRVFVMKNAGELVQPDGARTAYRIPRA